MQNMDLQKLVELGERLHYEGQSLRDFVQDEQNSEREERASRRAHEKEILEKQQEQFKPELKFKQDIKLKELDVEVERLRANDVNFMDRSDVTTARIKLPTLTEFVEGKDDMDSFLFRFEKFATTQGWKHENWAMCLSALLSGKALDVYSRLGKNEVDDYEKLKVALLKRYDLSEEGFRNKFSNSRIDGETPSQFMDRLQNYLERWIEFSEIELTYDGIIDLLIREQFLSTCNKSLSVFLKERTQKCVKDMAFYAEQYIDGHGNSGVFDKSGQPQKQTKNTEKVGTSGNRQFTTKTCFKCGIKGHLANQCRVKKNFSAAHAVIEQPSEKSADDMQETGASCVLHLLNKSDNCISGNKLNLACGKELTIVTGACQQNRIPSSSNWPVVKGKVGDVIVKTLGDSGCSGVVVQANLIKAEQYTGKVHLSVLIDGTVKKVPMARVHVDTPYFVGEVEAMCMDKPIYPLVLGNIEGIRDPSDPDTTWSTRNIPQKEDIDTAAVTTRAKKLKKNQPLATLKTAPAIDAGIGVDKFKEEQLSYGTLKTYFDHAKAGRTISLKGGNRAEYTITKELLYRTFHSRRQKSVRQLIVPKNLRQKVKLAHESILGHLGIQKTCDKVMSNFFWPGIQGDITRSCRSCDQCQKTLPKGRVTRVLMDNMPLIDNPFQRAAIDLVGPITPATESGNRYILTMVDYATCYPEAIALPKIETERIAEALISLFKGLGYQQKSLVTGESIYISTDERSE